LADRLSDFAFLSSSSDSVISEDEDEEANILYRGMVEVFLV
jgi:hypothetical protein